jgi:hypothetical protein
VVQVQDLTRLISRRENVLFLADVLEVALLKWGYFVQGLEVGLGQPCVWLTCNHVLVFFL